MRALSSEHLFILRLGVDPYDVKPGRITMRMIAAEVAEAYRVSVDDLTSMSRKVPLVHIRQEAMWLMRQKTKASLPQIGAFLGGRDHTTVLHGIRQVEKRRAEVEQKQERAA